MIWAPVAGAWPPRWPRMPPSIAAGAVDAGFDAGPLRRNRPPMTLLRSRGFRAGTQQIGPK